MLKQTVFRHIVALVLGCSAVGAHSSLAQENKSVTLKSGFVTTSDGVKIHYLEAGSAEGVTNSPAIQFVPGWTMPADIWEHQIRYLSRRLVDELPVFQRDSDFMKWYFDLTWNLQQDRRATTAKFVREMYKKPQTEQYLQRITTETMHTPTNTAIALLDAWVARDRAPMLAKVDKPTLIVACSYGGDLGRKSEEAVQGRIRGSRFEFFEDASHALFVDDADRFNALLEDFFGRVNR